jgi:hypothetical protein
LWRVLEASARWVEDGGLVFPVQVEIELRSYGVPDSITAWAAGVKDRRRYSDPDFATVRKIMDNETVQRVADWSQSTKADPADPYVLAQAVELQDDGHDISVVSEDRRDKSDGYGRLKKSSVVTCCKALGLSAMPVSDFLPLLQVEL